MDSQTENQGTSASTPPVPVDALPEPQSVDNPAAEVGAGAQPLSGQVAEITAEVVQVTQGGVGQIKAETSTVTVKQGGVGMVMAQTANIEVTEGGVGMVLGREINVRNSNVSVAMAGKISGDARIMIDVRAGLIAGIAIGVVLSAFQMLLKRRR